jgi:hypothetical protein
MFSNSRDSFLRVLSFVSTFIDKRSATIGNLTTNPDGRLEERVRRSNLLSMKEKEDELDEDDEGEVMEHLLELAKQKENSKAALPTILEKEELLKKLLGRTTVEGLPMKEEEG